MSFQIKSPPLDLEKVISTKQEELGVSKNPSSFYIKDLILATIQKFLHNPITVLTFLSFC